MRPTPHSASSSAVTLKLSSVAPAEELAASQTAGPSDSTIELRQHDPAANPIPNSPASETPILPHTTPVIGVRGTQANHAAQHINTEPQMIAEGVFTGEGRAKSGEKFFLKMEKITATNVTRWSQYLQITNRFTDVSRGLLNLLVRSTKESISEDGTIHYINSGYEQLAPRLGMPEDEFESLITLLGQGGFTSAPDNHRKSAAIGEIISGAKHLSLTSSYECYVVYATKTANFQLPSSPAAKTEVFASWQPTLKEYFRLYGDLLMCVGSDFSEPGSFHSRGIFRNPCSMIEGTYKGLAMTVHGFTGAVAKKFFAAKQFMLVKPMSSMQFLISSSLEEADYSVEGFSHEKILAISKKMLDDSMGFEMPLNSIKISAVDQLYRNHAST